MKKSILFLLHLPPPVHGSSMVGKWIKGSESINKKFKARYINLLASKTINDSGRISLSKILGFIIVWFKVLKQLVLNRPEVCYLALSTTGVAFYKDVFLIFLLKVFRIKRVYHLHNKGVKNATKTRIKFLLYSFAFKDAKVILLSQLLYEDVKAFVNSKDVFICPNGIPNLDGYKWADRKDNKIPNILFLSNLIESKGVFILLEALKLLRDRGVIFKSTFVGGEGDISASSFQIKVEKLMLEDVVEYKGKRFGVDKILVLEEADIFAFPTYYKNECLPLVLLEAMQFGIPIVCSPEGGIPDVVEEDKIGFLVPQGDTFSLANSLEKLINDNELRIEMGNAGRKRYKEKFTLKAFEDRMVEILYDI